MPNPGKVYSQEMLGLSLSNYGGIHTTFINPATILQSKRYIDITLASGDLFIQNNNLYLPKGRYTLRNFWNLSFPVYPESGRNFLDYYNKDYKHAYLNIRAIAPSMNIIINKKHALGFVTNARAMTSVKNLPYHISKFMLEGLNFEPQQNIRFNSPKTIHAASAAWLETGIVYNYEIYGRYDERLIVGASVKRLMSYYGTYLWADRADYMTPHKDTMYIYLLNAEAGISVPIGRTENQFLGWDNPIRGKGFAGDFGITYVRTLKSMSDRRYRKLCMNPYNDYKYKIGLSLIDLGSLRYSVEAQNLAFDRIDTVWIKMSSFKFTNLENFYHDLSLELTGNENTLLAGNVFSVMLPTALSLQAEYNFENNLYLNASVVHPMIFSHSQIVRSSSVNIVPRYETDLIELALPLSLFNYRQPRIGMFLRFKYFSVGTEKLGAYLGLSDFTGMDFYASLQFGFQTGKCRNLYRSRNCDTFK